MLGEPSPNIKRPVCAQGVSRGSANFLKDLEYLKHVSPDIYHEAMRTPTLDDPDPLARKILRRLHNLREVK